MSLEFKDTLWVLRRDELLVHVSVDISLITKHILDHVISLESWDSWLSAALPVVYKYPTRYNSNLAKK